MKNNLNIPAHPYPKQIFGTGEDYQEINGHYGFTKHELAALMIAQGLVSKYNMSTPEDQQIIAKLSYELSAEVLNQFS